MANLNKINYINIGLMMLSMLLAFVVPFELFLFVYAVLGPLHYLTEISWLHDRNYFTTSKYDVILLVACGLGITLSQYDGFKFLAPYDSHYIYLALFGAIILAFVKNNTYKVIGLVLIALTSMVSSNMTIFLGAFVPTLIHVYVFTGFFILFGALKSKSTSGYLSLLVFIAAPLALIYLDPDARPRDISAYALEVYPSFAGINIETLKLFQDVEITGDNFHDSIFNSNAGIVLMRFIAFAYTYHYLNWFSKTNVIKWHEVPKVRFAVVILLWIVSVALYAYDYKVGFEWLFFLSFAHVLLEFPLNHVSINGIFRELGARLGMGKSTA
jgi:hypothetical protein